MRSANSQLETQIALLRVLHEREFERGERAENILLLVEYFVGRYANAAGKNIRHIGMDTLEALRAYQWPGNIRERRYPEGRRYLRSG